MVSICKWGSNRFCVFFFSSIRIDDIDKKRNQINPIRTNELNWSKFSVVRVHCCFVCIRTTHDKGFQNSLIFKRLIVNVYVFLMIGPSELKMDAWITRHETQPKNSQFASSLNANLNFKYATSQISICIERWPWHMCGFVLINKIISRRAAFGGISTFLNKN